MVSVPRLQGGLLGTSLKMNTLIMLCTVLTIDFFGLVIKTSMEMETKNPDLDDEDQFDVRYVLNMVVAILLFFIAPLGVYGVYRERANFILSYLVMHSIGTALLAVNTLIEFIEWMDAPAASTLTTVLSCAVMTAFFVYSMLMLHSFNLQVKEQREELQ